MFLTLVSAAILSAASGISPISPPGPLPGIRGPGGFGMPPAPPYMKPPPIPEISKEGTYFISFSRDVQRGQPFMVAVNILNSSYPVRVKAELQRMHYNMTNSYKIPVTGAEDEFYQGQMGRLLMNVPANIESGRYVMHVRGSNGLQFEREKDVNLNYRSITVMIQTDKGMYKPGQKVQFRVFGIYADGTLYKGKFQVSITDPNWNKIKVWPGLQTPGGVVMGEFQLAEQTVFGKWTVKAQPDDQAATSRTTFEVQEYNLPRFEVTVELPDFGVTSNEVLSGTVKARYTFGKDVKGMVELRVAQEMTYIDLCGPPPPFVQLAFPINGEAPFTIPLSDIKRLSRLEGQTMLVTAVVKEELTGVKLNGSNSLDFHKHPYKIEILPSSPKTFSPNLPYAAIIKVTQPDGRPVTGSTHPVSVYTCVTYREVKDDQSMYGCREFTGTYGLPGQNHSLPNTGQLTVSFEIPTDAYSLEIKAIYREVSDTYTVNKKDSLSDSYIQVRLEATAQVKAKGEATFKVLYTGVLESFAFQIISRGKTIMTDHIPTNGQNPQRFRVPVFHSMAPVSYIVVYYVKPSGEVVSDSISFTVDDVFDNKVSLAFSKSEAQPNEAVDVTMTADAMSSVYVTAVDQKVLLLKEGNDITTDKVVDQLKTYGSGYTSGEFSPEVYAIASSAGRSPEIFSNAGLVVITDAGHYDHVFPPPPMPGPMPYMARNMAYGMAADDSMMVQMSPPASPQMSYASGAATKEMSGGYSEMGGAPKLKKVERVRNVFPETWLWFTAMVGATNTTSVRRTVPDSITSWVASAFAVNPNTGLGVAPTTAKLKVFQSFFVSVSMPTSVLRGEQVVIQASVFNYLNSDMAVTVQLENTDGQFANLVIDSFGKTREDYKPQFKQRTVKPNQPQTFYFPIIPKVIGTIQISISARSQWASDAVRKQLLVHSEGIKREYNVPMFVGLAPNGPTFRKTVSLTLPPETVRGSEKAMVKVTGNLIGTSLDNIDELLAMPTGCGEQNMMNFAPNVFIGRYLSITSQMTPARWSKITNNLELGLQRQLTYQRTDGSFSPFGNKDEAGSMWLTAYVTRVFHQARPFVLIDNSTLTRALNWMQARQNKDGSFNEPGLVIDKKAQRSPEALTALVLWSLLENQELLDSGPDSRYATVTTNAIRYLETRASAVTDQFTLAVLSVVLYRVGSSMADIPYNKLQAKTKYKGVLRYWSDTDPFATSPKYYTTWSPPTPAAQPLDVQITSYALMAFSARNDVLKGFPVTMWLSQQRNTHGGFATTRDTMVALEALSDFTQRVNINDFKLDLTIRGPADSIQVTLNKNNALVLQSKELSVFPNEVVVTATGVGVAYVEVNVFYHVNAEIGNPSFDINAVLLDDSMDNFKLMVCTKWLREEESSGMAAMEIAIPSGFEADMSSIGNVAGLKRRELRGRTVVVYFDQIAKTSTCFNIIATRTGMVINNQDSYITVYDYYQPDHQASIFYQPRSLKSASICDICKNCCAQNVQ